MSTEIILRCTPCYWRKKVIQKAHAAISNQLSVKLKICFVAHGRVTQVGL